MSKRMQEYGTCILLHLVMPLLPLILEKIFTGEISPATLMMATSIYAITVGNLLKQKFFTVLSLLIGIIFAVAYGITIAEGSIPLPPNTNILAFSSILFIFVISLTEKFAVHITNGFECREYNL